MKASQSVRQAAARAAERRIVMLEDPTRPPSPEALWRHAWFAAYTAPGQEPIARQALSQAGYATFLPVRTFWNAMRFRTKRQLEAPLLVRYLFVGVQRSCSAVQHLQHEVWADILQADGVTALLGDASGPLRVPVENLVQLAGEVVAGAYDETGVSIAAGTTLTVTKGALAGFPVTVEHDVHRDTGPDDMIAVMSRILGHETLTKIALADLRR